MTFALRATALLMLAMVAAPGAPAQSRAGTGTTLAYTVTDSSLRGPATFTAPGGVVTIQVVNRGRGVHQLLVATVLGGTGEEAKAYLLAREAPPPLGGNVPPGTPSAIGIGPVDAGQTVAVTLKLDAGTYLLYDSLPDPRGNPNFKAGIVAQLTGTGAPSRDLVNIPAVAGVMISNRFRFGNLIRNGNTWTLQEGRDRNTRVPRGLQTIRIESFVAGVHSVVVARGGPEVMRQYVAWKEGRRSTPPAGLVGGVMRVPGVSSQPGRMSYSRVFLQVQLSAGGYIAFCPEHDRTGLYGFETGEFTSFAVQ